MVTISPAIYSCCDCIICLKEVTGIRIQRTVIPVCRKINYCIVIIFATEIPAETIYTLYLIFISVVILFLCLPSRLKTYTSIINYISSFYSNPNNLPPSSWIYCSYKWHIHFSRKKYRYYNMTYS